MKNALSFFAFTRLSFAAFLKTIFRHFTLPIIVLITTIGCSSPASQTAQSDLIVTRSKVAVKQINKFNNFIKGFKTLKYPINIKTLNIDPALYHKFAVADNFFIKSEYPNETYFYGILPDTLECYKVIWFKPAETLIPVLTTFTKDGKKINEKELSVGDCGSDCGFACNEMITINKNLNIFSVDSIRISECDTNGVKPNTVKKYNRYKEGRILKNGRIQLSKVLQKNL